MTDTGAASRRSGEPVRAKHFQPSAILAEDRPGVLPLLSQADVSEALARLKACEIDRALRQRMFPVKIAPGTVSFAAGVNARPAGQLPVVAAVPQRELLWALQEFFDLRLKRDSVGLLKRLYPDMSASTVLDRNQRLILMAGLLLLSAAAVWLPESLTSVVRLLFCLFFSMVIAIKSLALLSPLARAPPPPPPLRPEDLPVFSVLIPLFRETAVLGQLLLGLEKLRYPRDKLDIKIIIEAIDTPMRRACAALRLSPHLEIIVVPQGGPQTKPKALNYALQFARGDIISVFDAEDIPERDQLLKAAAAFAVMPPEVICLQASLHFYNANQNWLTRQFAIEYSSLFDFVLPALAMQALPLPLGGTSNHFRAARLREIGGWDPFNVTEDADLGLRMARFGMRSATLGSITHEEATSGLLSWLRQRARWQKGYMQTWLVHMRRPKELWRDIGKPGFCAIQAVMLGTTLSAVLHPVFLALFAWDVADGTAFPPDAGVYKVLVNSTALFILLAGYGIGMGLGVFAALKMGRTVLLRSIPAMPAYWLLVSFASWRAIWDLATAPHHWHKTDHGRMKSRPRPQAKP